MYLIFISVKKKKKTKPDHWSSHCGAMGLTVAWELQDAGMIPGLKQWVKDPALPRLQPQLGSDPWPRNSICHGVAKKRKKGEGEIIILKQALFIYLSIQLFRAAPVAHGSSQARGQIRAAAASLYHSHSNARSELHLRPITQLMATPDP